MHEHITKLTLGARGIIDKSLSPAQMQEIFIFEALWLSLGEY